MTSTNNHYQSASLYVGDLHPAVTEAILFELFKSVGPVVTIHVCRDAVTRRSLGYAYVNFNNAIDAERALDTLNYTPIRGKPCRIMWSYRDPSMRKSGQGNIFIKNLDKSIDNKVLFDTFSSFGNILSCKVVTDNKGNSKGYGFVHYENQESAEQAINKVHGMLLANKIVFVGVFVPRRERIPTADPDKFTNLYVKHLPATWTEADLKQEFEKYGPVQNAVVMRSETTGESKKFGFVNFEKHEDSTKAIEATHNKIKLGGAEKEAYVTRAQKRGEREQVLKKLKDERAQKYQGINLYVKFLDDSIDDAQLRERFQEYGNITSCTVMRDEKSGVSRGFGFVCYESPEEASRAVAAMHGTLIAGKPIYVSLAERKDMRRSKLEAQYAARRMANSVMGNPNVYPVFYAQAPQHARGPAGAPYGAAPAYPGMVPRGAPRGPWGAAPAGIGAQGGARGQQFVPYMGVAHQGARGGPRQNGRGAGQQRGGAQGAAGAPAAGAQGAGQAGGAGAQGAAAAGAQGQQGGNNFNNNKFRYTPNARNQGTAGNGSGNGNGGAGAKGGKAENYGMVSSTSLTSGALANAGPDEQRLILGESLYPKIRAIYPGRAGKITGMLLEGFDSKQLLQLLDSQELLQEKIEDARNALIEAGEGVENDEVEGFEG